MRIGFEPASRLIAVEHRELNVHEDQCRRVLGCLHVRLLPIFSFNHFVAGKGQKVAQDLPIVLLIFDDEYDLTHASFPAWR